MITRDPPDPLPAHAYIPGGPYPRPDDEIRRLPVGRIADDGADWPQSAPYLRGISLWNAGYYWEAHEVWESLWHAHGRTGPTADIIKALIKLAAAGVKVRQNQRHGIVIHAQRAADLLRQVEQTVGDNYLGLDLSHLAKCAQAIANYPPTDPLAIESPVARVFDFTIEPK